MRKHKTFLFALVAMCGACSSHWQLSEVGRTRIVVDSTYDAVDVSEAAAWLAPYKRQVDSVMSPVVGEIARYMSARKPESELSNLLCDILVWEGRRRGEQPDLAVYNMGGIRAAFSKGTVTYGDVLAVAPFENKICFLTLTGSKMRELCSQIASRGGEGVSHGMEMTISPEGKLLTARLNGEEIRDDRSYRVATLDFLAQGNDGLLAFRDATDVVSPQDAANNVRFIIMDYFRAFKDQGQAVDSRTEGRIVVRP